jgi:hypothetical protein
VSDTELDNWDKSRNKTEIPAVSQVTSSGGERQETRTELNEDGLECVRGDQGSWGKGNRGGSSV